MPVWQARSEEAIYTYRQWRKENTFIIVVRGVDIMVQPDDKSTFLDKHVMYEVQMFQTAAIRYDREDLEGYEKDAAIEVFLLHFRNLYEFFYNDTPQQDDVTAVAFFDDSCRWRNERPKKSELTYISSDYRDAVNKELAHITKKRENSNTTRWPIGDMYNEMMNVIEQFLALLPDELQQLVELQCPTRLSRLTHGGAETGDTGVMSTGISNRC